MDEWTANGEGSVGIMEKWNVGLLNIDVDLNQCPKNGEKYFPALVEFLVRLGRD